MRSSRTCHRRRWCRGGPHDVAQRGLGRRRPAGSDLCCRQGPLGAERRKHGLNVQVYYDPNSCATVAAIACEIAPECKDFELIGLAHRIAEAQVDLMRVARARCDMLSFAMADPGYRVMDAGDASTASATAAQPMRSRPAAQQSSLQSWRMRAGGSPGWTATSASRWRDAGAPSGRTTRRGARRRAAGPIFTKRIRKNRMESMTAVPRTEQNRNPSHSLPSARCFHSEARRCRNAFGFSANSRPARRLALATWAAWRSLISGVRRERQGASG
jgi:hypothetical protein